MDKIYHQPNHLWKGQKAVKKLKEYSKEKPKVIKRWLSRQAFWQVHLPAPKRVDRPHYEETTPNEMHQFDLLYMPSYKHIHTAFVEALNKILADRLFKVQDAQELNDPEKVSAT